MPPITPLQNMICFYDQFNLMSITWFDRRALKFRKFEQIIFTHQTTVTTSIKFKLIPHVKWHQHNKSKKKRNQTIFWFYTLHPFRMDLAILFILWFFSSLSLETLDNRNSINNNMNDIITIDWNENVKKWNNNRKKK